MVLASQKPVSTDKHSAKGRVRIFKVVRADVTFTSSWVGYVLAAV